MATNFPNSPSNGDTHTFGGATYTYNSTIGAWTGPSTTVGGGGASVTVSETAPSNPSEGDLWFDPSVLKTFVYYNDGTANQWVQNNPTGSGGSSGGASVTASDTAPTSPSAGDLWFKSDTGALYVYYTDADSSQWVGISGPAGAAGADGADGASVSVSYANLAAFPSSPTEGDLAYAQDTNTLYVYDGSEWDRISSGSDESPRVTTEPATSHNLNTDGTTSTVTMVAEDPEGFDIEYGIKYNTSGNTLPSPLASATTINQSTGVFTFTPTTTTSNAGSFVTRLTASDGNRVTTRNVTVSLNFTSFQLTNLSGGTVSGTGGVTYTSPSGMVLTASTANYPAATYTLDKIFDGQTSGTLGNYWLSSGSTTDTLTFDFSNATNNSGNAMAYIQKIVVTPYCRSDTFSNITKIERSSNGSTWTQTHGDQGYTSSNSGDGVSHTLNLNTYDLYFRISLSRTGSWGTSINEVVVWGY